MNYKMVDKEAFKIVGKGIQVSTVNGENHRAIPAFWGESNQNGFSSELAKHSGTMGLLGVCMQYDRIKEEFRYVIAVEKLGVNNPIEWEEYTIPASSWAVFESIGPMPDSIQHVWEYVYSDWFPSSGYEHVDAPELEVYPEGDTTSANYRCEVWIPVRKK